ncbi:MAG: ROK family protein, partial [Gemmatimonadota bacterium]|nr:ROK family protein [Gemmatimonadota bacterium]
MILAIDIGGSQFALALATPDGRIIKHIQHQTDRADHADKRIDRILAASKTLISQSSVSACGIGFGGPVNFDTQRIVNSTHVSGWDDCPLPEIVEQHLGVPAIIDNDANVGALGEFTFGAG